MRDFAVSSPSSGPANGPQIVEALKEAAKALHKGAYYPRAIRGMLLDAIAAKNNLERDHLLISSGSRGISISGATNPPEAFFFPEDFWVVSGGTGEVVAEDEVGGIFGGFDLEEEEGDSGGSN